MVHRINIAVGAIKPTCKAALSTDMSNARLRPGFEDNQHPARSDVGSMNLNTRPGLGHKVNSKTVSVYLVASQVRDTSDTG